VSTEKERQQTKIVLFAFLFYLSFMVVMFISQALFPSFWSSYLSFTVLSNIIGNSFFTLLLPLALGLAVFRDKLYNIDILIKRTLAYGLLTIILLLMYLTLVFIGQNLLVSALGLHDTVVLVVSTLIVAVLFQPLRQRVQWFVDQRFYRKQYNAEKTLASFSALLHEEVDLEQLQTRLLGVIEETIQPAHVSLWLCEAVSLPISEQSSDAAEASGQHLAGASPSRE
jgi:hypothetical protein